MEARPSQGIQTQQPIKDLSPSRPAFCHLEIHTISVVAPEEGGSHDGIQPVSPRLTLSSRLTFFFFFFFARAPPTN